jgi:DNA-directed RNA polymerase sigma subunit (sigma70/sigma32)
MARLLQTSTRMMSLRRDSRLDRYAAEIKQSPLLSRDEELVPLGGKADDRRNVGNLSRSANAAVRDGSTKICWQNFRRAAPVLARTFREHHEPEVARHLAIANLRFVLKVAHEFSLDEEFRDRLKERFSMPDEYRQLVLIGGRISDAAEVTSDEK